jgi:hypothetical protein
MSKRIFASVVCAVLCAGVLLLLTAFVPSNTQSSAVPTLKSSVILPDGAEQATFSNGAVFVGTPGTKITFKQTPNGFAMGTTPPDPATVSGELAMANVYWAQGRSPARDTADAGGLPTKKDVALSAAQRNAWLSRKLNKTALKNTAAIMAASCHAGSLWDSGIASINDSHTNMKGAYRRYTTCDSDPKNHYTYENSQMSGQGHNPCWYGCATNKMGTEHVYGHGSIIKWQPQSDEVPSGSSCQTQTVGMSAYGFSLSDSIQVCPNKIHPNVPYRDFTVEWQGCTNSGATKAADAFSSDKVINGVSADFTYYVYYSWNQCNW